MTDLSALLPVGHHLLDTITNAWNIKDSDGQAERARESEIGATARAVNGKRITKKMNT